MSNISLHKMKSILGTLMDQRVMPLIQETNSTKSWLLGGASALVLMNLENAIKDYIPTLQQVGIMDSELNINYESTKTFLDNAFRTQPTVRMDLWGIPITFDKSDGEALLKLMSQYKEQNHGQVMA